MPLSDLHSSNWSAYISAEELLNTHNNVQIPLLDLENLPDLGPEDYDYGISDSNNLRSIMGDVRYHNS